VKDTGLRSMRANMRIDPSGKIRVAFLSPPFADSYDAVFECLSCDDLLVWESKVGWWTCPSCAYELTPDEADDVITQSQMRLKCLSLKVRPKGTRWGWVIWLLRLLRITA
jgi:hypothetical protein